MEKIKVLFVCIHNSARSQMAEAFTSFYSNHQIEAYSAGFEPGVLNPLVVKSMHDVGIDISQNHTKSVFDFYKQSFFFNYVITVCDESRSQRCPIFPGLIKQIHWNIEDPSTLSGDEAEVLQQIAVIRDEIEHKVKSLVDEITSMNAFI